MADVPDEGEFRLPSEFLPDDLFMETEVDSFGSTSVLSSPVESTVSSYETESSDEDFLAVLTQRLAHSSLSETKNQQEKKIWFVGVSPQTTVAGIGKYLNSRTMSSNGSPEGPFQFPSPPETPFGAEKDTWDLVYSGAKRVGKLNTGYETFKEEADCVSQTRSHPSSRCTRTLPCLKSSSSGSYSDPRLFQDLPQWGRSLECRKIAAFAVAQQQRHRFVTLERNIIHENGRCEPPEALFYHPWRTQNQSKQPQHNRLILQPPINGGSAVKRESVGTGVFLPRNYANPPEQRKLTAPKYGISTQRRHGDHRSDAAALQHQQLLHLDWNY